MRRLRTAALAAQGSGPCPLYVQSAGASRPRSSAPWLAGSIQLPNVGREGHTFLHHLHSRYDSLARVTLFLMGSAAYSE